MSTSATAPNREPECEIATCSWPLGPCQRRCAPNRESDHVIPDGCRDGCEHETLPADGPPVEDRLEPSVTDRFRCNVDRSGSGMLRQVLAVDATSTHDDVLIWTWATHIDGPMSPDAESLWNALCTWTGYVDDGS